MPVDFTLIAIVALLVLAPVATALCRMPTASPLIYTGCLLLAAAIAGNSIAFALGGAETSSEILPLGVPWIGAHFREDALSSVFLAVVNLGAAGASLYALGYGRHEPAPSRVGPLYPPFLARMHLGVRGDGAVRFLLSRGVW